MSDSLLETEFYVDDANSELSIFRLDAVAVHEEEEKISTMLSTARLIGASPAVMQELGELVENQPKERELSSNEVENLEEALVREGLENLGVLANRHGITFGFSRRSRGDGTVPVLSLQAIVTAFQNVFADIQENSFAQLTFNGVVALKNSTNTQIALHIRDSKISVQRAQVVWETIDGLEFERKPAPAAKPTPKNVPKKTGPAYPNGPFTKCWG